MKTNTISLLKKKHFYFRRYRDMAYIVLKVTFSNVFLTMIDHNKKVIISKSAGSVHLGTSKRKKGHRRLLNF